MPRDFFGEKLRKTIGYPSSWPGRKNNNDYGSYIPFYKELSDVKIVHRGKISGDNDNMNINTGRSINKIKSKKIIKSYNRRI